MTENPYEPPVPDARLEKGPSKFEGSRLIWGAVVVLAALAGISSSTFALHASPIRPAWLGYAANWMFWVGPPLAMFLVIVSREMKLRRLTHGKAFYKSVEVFFYSIGFLFVGYSMFVPTCTGAGFALIALYPPTWAVREGSLVGVATFFMTIIACVAMQGAHRHFRKG